MSGLLSQLYTPFVGALCLAIYYLNSLFALRNTTELPTKKHFLLVTAHPDDECMFFSPCLIGLLGAGNEVTVLCLSAGNADGLGHVREKELRASCTKLGFLPDHVHVHNHDKLQDSIDMALGKWDVKVIAREIAVFIKTGKRSIDAFLTFDEHGVSGHPNHKSILPGVQQYISSLPKTSAKPQLWTLLSTGLVRKYSGIFDALPCLMLITLRVARSPGRGSKKKENYMTFMSDPLQVIRGQDAMVRGHPSQMRWFRWFWVVIGRYMYFNELKKVQ